MSSFFQLIDKFRRHAKTQREKGNYFEDLMLRYFSNEPKYQELYNEVFLWQGFRQYWLERNGEDLGIDTGIDLVAKVRDTEDYHAIQCKLYSEDYNLQKKDIDSFFTASGKRPFTHRMIVSTTNHWSKHAKDALKGQHLPVQKIDLYALEHSVIDWEKYQPKQQLELKPKKNLRSHQKQALQAVTEQLNYPNISRGKLIMACGTGKTFTSLKIAEAMAGRGKRVLFLVPSLSLLSQTLTEWTQESSTPLCSFAVCSDSDIGKKRQADEDAVNLLVHELDYPATTNAKRLAEEMQSRHKEHKMSVVFSTYHSINVISEAQNSHLLPEFDFVICDEAHRTTGATFDGEDDSAFTSVHDEEFIHAKKRLYMTATPRIYSEDVEINAERDKAKLYGMNNEAIYGKELFVINFSEAVQRGLLVDYKVIVLAVDESHVNKRLQDLLADENNSLKVDDAAKIIGCWKALSKQNSETDLQDDPNPMQRAVAFCQVIEPHTSKGKSKQHKVSSKNIAAMFQAVVEQYQTYEIQHNPQDADLIENSLQCIAEHIDGGMNATTKEEKLQWLKAQPEENQCKILSNVRCLSEGVDVPSLDAVLFLTPRNSQVDVVQSVGRVMRLAPNKKRGYIILPVVIPAGVEPHEALNDNKTYKVVWQVLQALRAHDDRFDAMINQLELNNKKPAKMEVIAISDKATKRQKTLTDKTKGAKGQDNLGKSPTRKELIDEKQNVLNFEIDELERAIYAKVVQKCGNRQHWEEWANDIAKIAKTHIDRITHILANPENKEEIQAFESFAKKLRNDLNDALSDAEIIEMLAQHLITKPVFDALFSEYDFAQYNPISLAMQDILNKLHEHHLEKEADTLNSFYASVKLRAEGIDNAQGKQRIIVELYDKFFRNAFPKMTERLGIVYTPVEVVDFIIHSVNDVLKSEFNQTLADDHVHIIDPFTGTGTFITRLLQSGLIPPNRLPYKYKHEIHANELVLLAYYIATINIEATYHDIIFNDYTPFEGVCLTDTFQMYEHDIVTQAQDGNSARRKRQKELDIQVIIGNPPYSAGQKSENDNNQNVAYPSLDNRISETYAKYSKASSTKNLMDSYIRAMRWASDRIGGNGVIGFVSNASFVDANSMDGLRKCLAEEFSSLYIFHLRGNARTSGEQRRKEKDNVFGQGTRTPIAVSILVKNSQIEKQGEIYFHDIGDYLTREQKLEKIVELKSITGISQKDAWQKIIPDELYYWINQRNKEFDGAKFISLGNKKLEESTLFNDYSQGMLTSRDAWNYNSNKDTLIQNTKNSINFYDKQRERNKQNNTPIFDNDPTKISWSSSLKEHLKNDREIIYSDEDIIKAEYRPFNTSWLCKNKWLNHRTSRLSKIFSDNSTKNKVISVTGRGSTKEFSALITEKIPDYELISKGQCFPLSTYEESTHLNDVLSTIDHRPSTIDHRPSTIDHRPSTIDHRPSTIIRKIPRKINNKTLLFVYH
ncbi:type ISP restriction/modification enzyme [Acinetobacter ursingii]|nr:type ISP restriction/modification enzyme [Acinetobacter ursingii]MEC6126854.1 type ISP restriction/modification enzyme [Acinetobacter ursingii]